MKTRDVQIKSANRMMADVLEPQVCVGETDQSPDKPLHGAFVRGDRENHGQKPTEWLLVTAWAMHYFVHFLERNKAEKTSLFGPLRI